MARIEFVRSSGQTGAYPAASTGRLVNFYPERLPEGALAAYILRGVLGLRVYAIVPGVFVRAMQSVGADMLVASGGRLSHLAAEGVVVDLGEIPDDPDTLIRGNNGVATITAGGRYFTWDGDALSEVTEGPFTEMGGHDVVGGYTVITQKGGRRFQWSGLQDPETLPGLSFATAEARDDLLIRPHSVNGNLWLFKGRSIEIWAQTGGPGAQAFARLPGAVIETGLRAFGLVCKVPDGVFFVTSDDQAVIGMGGQLQKVSTPAVEWAIANGEPTNVFFYRDEGHQFCVIRFADRPAWVFDLSEGVWHERATGESGAWDVQVAAPCDGCWFGAGQRGIVWQFGRNGRDDDVPLIRQATSHTAHNTSERFRVAKLEMHGRVGRAPGNLAMRLSRDHGKTWSPWKPRSMGGVGDWDQRITFRGQGQARQLTLQVRVTDAPDLSLLSAADVEFV